MVKPNSYARTEGINLIYSAILKKSVNNIATNGNIIGLKKNLAKILNTCNLNNPQ